MDKPSPQQRGKNMAAIRLKDIVLSLQKNRVMMKAPHLLLYDSSPFSPLAQQTP